VEHFGHALAAAYGETARAAEDEVKYIEVAKLAFPCCEALKNFI
jgi:hypothetical protein